MPPANAYVTGFYGFNHISDHYQRALQRNHGKVDPKIGPYSR